MAEKEITLTNLNIRQSISLLLGKLIFLDIFSAVLVVALYFGIITGGNWFTFSYQNSFLFLGLFVFIGLIKVFLDSYVILQWLNEYYEITPEYIIYKKGIFFKQTERHRIENIRVVDLSRGLLGDVFNFGSLILYDERMHEDLDMNYIHNPERYLGILQKLNPIIEEKKEKIRRSYHEIEEN